MPTKIDCTSASPLRASNRSSSEAKHKYTQRILEHVTSIQSFHLPSIKVMPCYVPKKESSITRIFRASTLCMMFGHWTLRTWLDMAWKCPLCVVFAWLTLDLLLSHLNLQHSHDRLNIKCRFDSCDRDYITINLFVKHVRDRHRACVFDSKQSNGTSILGK